MDDRGVATLVGLLLLIALVLLVFSITQATVVPGETRASEAAHNDQIQTEMVAFGDTIDRTARGGERVASLSLSPTYQDRQFLLSPPSTGGVLSTEPGTVSVSNANFSEPFSNEALFRAENPTLETNRLVFEPNYHEYDSGATVLYEHGVVGAQFPTGTRHRAGSLIDGETIRLTTVAGSVSRADRSTALTTQSKSQTRQSVTVRSDADDPLQIELPTELPADTWETALDGENATVSDHDESSVEVTFDPGTYELQLAGVGLDESVDQQPAYLAAITDEEVGPGERMTVEARDEHDNPVPGARLNVSREVGEGDDCEFDTVRTDDEGQATLRCETPGPLTVSIPHDEPTNYETIPFVVTDQRGDRPVITANSTPTERAFDTDEGVRNLQQLRVNYTAASASDQTNLSLALLTVENDSGIVTADTQDLSEPTEDGQWTSPWMEPGNYTVNIRIRDETGAQQPLPVPQGQTVESLRADAGADRTVGFGETVSFDGRNSTGDIVSYEWSFGDGTTATGPQANHSYSAPGTYTVRLTVTDRNGNSHTDRVTVVVSDSLVANAGDDETVEIGESLQLDGTGSTGDIESYEWSFGDGTTAMGPTPIHSYDEPGTYTVELTVRTADGRTATDTATITVNDAAPRADAGPDRIAQVGESLTFDGGLSRGNIVDYEWEFDDETTDTGETVSKTYDTVDSYTVTLTVTDAQGRTDTDQATVTVQPEPVQLQAAAGPDRVVTERQVIQFDGRGSTGDIETYEWSFGDGTTATGPTPQHAFNEPGSYTVELTVTDSDGATSTDTLTVNVIQEEPGEPLEYVTGTAAAGGQTATDFSGARLSMRNTGTREIRITQVHVRAASSPTRTSNRVQFGGNRRGIWQEEVYINADRRDGTYKGTVTIGPAAGNQVTLDQAAAMSGGTTAPIYLYQFRPPGGGLDMRNGEVSLTITYEVAGETRQLDIDNARIL